MHSLPEPSGMRKNHLAHLSVWGMGDNLSVCSSMLSPDNRMMYYRIFCVLLVLFAAPGMRDIANVTQVYRIVCSGLYVLNGECSLDVIVLMPDCNTCQHTSVRGYCTLRLSGGNTPSQNLAVILSFSIIQWMQSLILF